EMYESEFELIWDSQAHFYPKVLTSDFRDKAYRAIFFQRKLKNQSHLIGKCALEPKRRRAPWALIDAQQFRYLKTLNSLEIEDRETGEIRALTDDERTKVIHLLETTITVKFSKIRQLLKLGRNTCFNLERGGEEKMCGNSTAARIVKVTGADYWTARSAEERNLLVNDVYCYESSDALVARLQAKWSLPPEQASALATISFEEGYCAFSRQALAKLLPHIKKGVAEATAIKSEYPERFARSNAAVTELPPVDTDLLPEMRNPIVVRALTELRRVVNAIIARYGLPDRVHIEMGRDLRQTPDQRERTIKKMRLNEKRRMDAADQIRQETAIQNPSRSDIERVLLANECGWECPYTGKHISMSALVGTSPRFDIEHIIPFDRCLDDSFLNKTLCDADENRHRKRNRTPFEAYHGDTQRWESILNRVRGFQSDLALEKLKRVRMTPDQVNELLNDFTARQLNDMRWASRWAKQYLGLLYGGRTADGIDDSGRRRVLATSGSVTGFLRREWGLNTILGDPEGLTKSRDDHRHHTIDAIVVSLSDPGTVQKLSRAASAATNSGRRLFADLPQPWENFHIEAASAVQNTITSHSLSKRVRGPLHADTFYGRPHILEGKSVTHLRTPLESLSPKDVENIVDPVIRLAVQDKLHELGLAPDKAFANPENRPLIVQTNGTKHAIRHVRVRRTLETYQVIGKPPHERFAMNEKVSHMEVFAVNRNGGEQEWRADVVPMLEAYRRRAAKLPIVNRDHGEAATFLFSLAGREIIELGELDKPEINRRLYVLRTIRSSQQVYFVPINDARTQGVIGTTGLTARPDSLRRRGCRKVVITPLGEVRSAND
ncbi:MAG: type II CRISPR RNA-guided endonuclease Cas9, partial [Candidatus Zixiibacteriota bacterium]